MKKYRQHQAETATTRLSHIVALYHSMLRGEIEECLDAWKTGQNAAGGIAKYMTSAITAFDSSVLYRPAKDLQIEPEGAKKFIHPKLFRRQCTWWAYRKKGSFKSGFDTFLKLSRDDVFYKCDDFLGDAPYVAVQIPLADMVKHGKKVIYRAEDVVFQDAPSTLYDAQGERLESW